MGLLMEVARCIAHDTAVFDGALAAHSGMNPIDKNGSAPWVGAVRFWSLAYLDNSILLDSRLQEFCAIGRTTFEYAVLGFCKASVRGHHHVCRTL